MGQFWAFENKQDGEARELRAALAPVASGFWNIP